MAGNKAGGIKTRDTNRKKYGADYYTRLGMLSGRVNHPETRYFHRDPAAASRVGKIGGLKSKRGPSKPKVIEQPISRWSAVKRTFLKGV